MMIAGCAWAHVGSPDIFFQGKAGTHALLVAVRPPDVIPGVARVEVRALSDGVEKVEVFPTPISGEAAKHPPVAEVAQRSASDTHYFEASVWLMSFGSWEVHVRVNGSNELLVPVPALALKTRPMSPVIGYFLAGMMVFLTVGMVAIVGAGVREAEVEPGSATRPWTARSLAAMGIASI